MIIPLELLEEERGNMYEVSVAAIRRAYQITMTGDEELDVNNGKIVSTAISQVLRRKVQFQLEES
jgi:DNA-directed RNA polymerase subunit omega